MRRLMYSGVLSILVMVTFSLGLSAASPSEVAQRLEQAASMSPKELHRCALQVIRKHSASVRRLKWGHVWLSYIDGVSLSWWRQTRALPMIPQVQTTIGWMHDRTVSLIEKGKSGGPYAARFVHLPRFLKKLERDLVQASQGKRIGRAHFYTLALRFSAAASLALDIETMGAVPFVAYGDNFANPSLSVDYLNNLYSITEQWLDSVWGVSALLLPTELPLNFFAFLDLEPGGLSPIGLIDNVASVDRSHMASNTFLEHDEEHARNRFRDIRIGSPNPSYYYLRNRTSQPDRWLSLPGYDYMIYVGLEDALQFHLQLKLLRAGVEDKRLLSIQDGVLFFLIREDFLHYFGTIDFNARYFIERLEELLTNEEYFAELVNRLQGENDLGQAYSTPPSEEELRVAVSNLKGRMRLLHP